MNLSKNKGSDKAMWFDSHLGRTAIFLRDKDLEAKVMKIIAYGIREDEKPYVAEWQEQHPDVQVKIVEELLLDSTVDQAEGFDGVVAYQQAPYTDNVLKTLAGYGIHYLSLRNVGVDNLNPVAVKENDFKITNVPVYSPAAIAEFSVTQLMNLLRRTKEYFRKFDRRDYRWAPEISQELNQQVVGVIGTGHIGQVAIDIYKGFRAKVIAYDKFHNPELEKEGLYVDSLDELFAQATVVTLHIPLFPETENMLNKEAFDKMNDGVFIVNASRGPLIDEKALIDALDSGKVAGAALDVLVDETKVFNHNMAGKNMDYPEFWNLESRGNVLISPHTAFYTNVAVENMVKQSLDANLSLIQTGASDHEVKFN